MEGTGASDLQAAPLSEGHCRLWGDVYQKAGWRARFPLESAKGEERAGERLPKDRPASRAMKSAQPGASRNSLLRSIPRTITG